MNAALKQGTDERPVFVQAAVNVSYPREFRFQRDDQTKLAEVARISGGRVLKLGDANVKLFQTDGTLPAESLRQMWDMLLCAATLLFIVDVAARRLVFQKRTANETTKVVVGQVGQAWKTARIRAADDMSQADLAKASIQARDRNAAANSTSAVNSTINPLEAQVDPINDSSTQDSLEQLSPLERLREAKRRARAADDATNQDDPT